MPKCGKGRCGKSPGQQPLPLYPCKTSTSSSYQAALERQVRPQSPRFPWIPPCQKQASPRAAAVPGTRKVGGRPSRPAAAAHGTAAAALRDPAVRPRPGRRRARGSHASPSRARPGPAAHRDAPAARRAPASPSSAALPGGLRAHRRPSGDGAHGEPRPTAGTGPLPAITTPAAAAVAEQRPSRKSGGARPGGGMGSAGRSSPVSPRYPLPRRRGCR